MVRIWLKEKKKDTYHIVADPDHLIILETHKEICRKSYKYLHFIQLAKSFLEVVPKNNLLPYLKHLPCVTLW